MRSGAAASVGLAGDAAGRPAQPTIVSTSSTAVDDIAGPGGVLDLFNLESEAGLWSR